MLHCSIRPTKVCPYRPYLCIITFCQSLHIQDMWPHMRLSHPIRSWYFATLAYLRIESRRIFTLIITLNPNVPYYCCRIWWLNFYLMHKKYKVLHSFSKHYCRKGTLELFLCGCYEVYLIAHIFKHGQPGSANYLLLNLI